jgi:cell shape-determining protein MreC
LRIECEASFFNQHSAIRNQQYLLTRMSYLRAQHVFFALMAFSAVLAFLVPAQYAGRFQPQVQRLFAPVSWPVSAIASSVSNRVAPPLSDDRRAGGDIKAENQQLRAEVALLQTQLDEMNRRELELSKLGAARDFCRIFKVVGGDSGTRDSLAISGSTLQGIKDEQYVLYPGGLVGQVQRAGVGGAQVRLATDPGFRIRIRFARFTTSNGQTTFEPLGTPAVVAEGMGDGTLAIRGLSLSAIGYDANGRPAGTAGESLREGTDYALLFDGDCPRVLQGETIGRVVRIAARTDARLFAEIRIRPNETLSRLREVMVMTKEKAED